MIKISKNVRDGDAVSLRGDKYIKCSHHAKIMGVYSCGEAPRKTIILSGSVVESRHPEGIVIWGPARVRIA